MRRILFVLVAILVLCFVYSTQFKETFINPTCGDYQTCVSCANKAKCSWCATSRTCISKSEINDTDTPCNPIHAVHAAPMCQADRPEEEPEQVLNSEIEDNPLYHEQIENKPFPPMIPVEQTQ